MPRGPFNLDSTAVSCEPDPIPRGSALTIDPPQTSTFNIHEVLGNEEMAGILVKVSTVTYDIVNILRRHQPADGYKNVRQMERAIEQEFYGSVNREFSDFPATLPQPTSGQLSKAESYKGKLNSVNYTF